MMNRWSHPQLLLAASLASVFLATGCGGAQQPAAAPRPPAASGTAVDVTPADANGGSHSGARSAGKPVVAPQLPLDWPRVVPLAPGRLLGATSSGVRWSALLLADGSSAAVMRSTGHFYVAAGFTAVTESILRKGRYVVTIGAVNRDHSQTKSNLVIAVTRLR